MDKATLVSPDLDAGRSFVEELDRAGVEVQAAFWYYDDKSEAWRLYLAMPLVRQRGLRETYTSLLARLEESGIRDLHLTEIAAVRTDEPVVRALSKLVRTDGGHELAGIRLAGNTVDGKHIQAAYVYRMNVRPPEAGR